jgi:SAM-dependent methyltransferase
MPPYRWLAEYYDRIFTNHPPRFASARRTILGGILPRVESACDLCCGTGTTALLLAQDGIRMYGVDLSPAMCRIARAKARRERLPLRVIRADMRDFRLPQPVDLVLCEYDALNHVARKQDLARVARAVSRALRPGGHFYFDVNNLLAFQKIWPNTWFLDQPDLAFGAYGGYDGARRRGWTNCVWFRREGRGWKRLHERVEQVAWTTAEMRRYLKAAGFATVRAWDAARLFPGMRGMLEGCRTFYLARKR